jgi:hypothetical protein
VLYECARCHERFRVDGEAESCPKCKAEAGLENTHEGDVPPAMRGFGAVLAFSLLLGAVGSVWGVLDPGPASDQPHWMPNIHK